MFDPIFYKRFFLLLVTFFVFFFPRFVSAETIPLCPGYTTAPAAKEQGNYSKEMDDEDLIECEVPSDVIQISVPIPGLNAGAIEFYPVQYKTFKDSGGEQKWCYFRPLKKCYTVSGIQEYIRWIYTFLVSAIGIVAVGTLVYGGLTFVTAYGVAEKIQKAKDIIINSIMGLVIALLSYVILFTVNPNITSLSIPSIPPVPPVANPLEAELFCAITCGKISDAKQQGTTDEPPKKCMGVICPGEQACVIERSPGDPTKYWNGKCQSEYFFTYMNHPDQTKNNKAEKFPFEGDTTCTEVDKEITIHDEVGTKCANFKSCVFVLPVQGPMKVDYRTDPAKVSSEGGPKLGCF